MNDNKPTTPATTDRGEAFKVVKNMFFNVSPTVIKGDLTKQEAELLLNELRDSSDGYTEYEIHPQPDQPSQQLKSVIRNISSTEPTEGDFTPVSKENLPTEPSQQEGETVDLPFEEKYLHNMAWMPSDSDKETMGESYQLAIDEYNEAQKAVVFNGLNVVYDSDGDEYSHSSWPWEVVFLSHKEDVECFFEDDGIYVDYKDNFIKFPKLKELTIGRFIKGLDLIGCPYELTDYGQYIYGRSQHTAKQIKESDVEAISLAEAERRYFSYDGKMSNEIVLKRTIFTTACIWWNAVNKYTPNDHQEALLVIGKQWTEKRELLKQIDQYKARIGELEKELSRTNVDLTMAQSFNNSNID